jgi:hypothetical protein
MFAVPLLTVLTPAAYWRKLKQRLKAEGSEVVTFCHGLKLSAPDGKMRRTDCANTEGIFRIKQLKGLERENLRDHMTDLELIFSMLGEAATTEIARKQDAQGLGENKVAARKGGRIAGDARENLEQETGTKVVSPENYLTEPERKKRLKR